MCLHRNGGGENVVRFLMRNLVPNEDATNASTSHASKTHKQDTQLSAQFYSQFGQALLTIAKTCDSAHDLLWPYLFEFVCVEPYTPVLGDICKCLKILIIRHNEVKEGHDSILTVNTEENRKPLLIDPFILDFSAKLPGPHQVFSRLLICLNGAALNSSLSRRAVEIIGLMKELSPWLNPALADVLPDRLDKLSKFLEEMSTFYSDSNSLSKEPSSPTSDYTTVALKCAKTQRWQAAILDVLDSCIQTVIEGEWREKLAAAMSQQLRLYLNQPQDRCFLLRVIGFTLSRVANVAFVVDHIYLAFRSANHSNQNERMGCALLMGHCSQTHTELVLTELENISKWEHSKKSSGLFSIIKEATYGKTEGDDVVNLRATIILSYGYVMLYCPTDLVVQRLEKTVLPFLRQYLNSFKVCQHAITVTNAGIYRPTQSSRRPT